ncbi:MAG TPA: hypothetical protein VFX35_10840 [Solirubrobacterales bacterium]|nr:hypothetical protein [Solirubrobacterales bacterium]
MAREPAIEVGGYVLQLGEAGGTVVQQGKGRAEAEIGPLQHALEQPEPKAPDGPAVAGEVEEAAEATEKVEKAVALCKGVTEGRILSPDQLALEVGTLLSCLERLDKKKQHKESLRMARALATLLMLLKRWADLLQTLRIALRAGQELGDPEAVAWARHELGSLRLVAGDLTGADRDLNRAREIRERIGDRRGLATTNRNMGVLCEHMRAMLHNGELVESEAGNGRPSWRYLVAAAAAAAFLFLGGAAAGMIATDDNSENVAEEGVVTVDGPNNGDDGTKNTNGEKKRDEQNGNPSNPDEFLLTVNVEGDGFVAVTRAGVASGISQPGCDESCSGKVPAGETVIFEASEDEGSEFVGFSGCTSDGPTCALEMTGPKTVTATFEPIAKGSGDGTEPDTTTGPSPEELQEQAETETEAQEATEEEAAGSELVE